ncbi:glycine--tRNA ligase subunit beta [Neorickettsia findlayensis]|uniref:Glycine--tRNA ligase beta subunit n=1 Tax=Neorickettsia findlayensis TaxID=2686014 RepID=A0A6P1GB66_9RICK|nr:glycine--tRNA ligase subunit beta [Neorickettsia findlayensis]QHD65404.1 glycine--tRNA ligase subunit beta [Neorickettsia findlayensis]
MPKFLLEILSEEMPVALQSYAQKSFFDLFSSATTDLSVGKIEVFTSCRRVAVLIDDVNSDLVNQKVDKKGPSVGSDLSVVERFATSMGTSTSDLYIKSIGNKEYYFAPVAGKVLCIDDIMRQRIEAILGSFSWPRSMRWGNYSLNWIRPIKSIVCMLGKSIIPVQFHHYTAGAVTVGPYVDPALQKIKITSAEEYQSILMKGGVILSQVERENLVKEQISQLEAKHGFSVCVTEESLNEVVGITESPNVLLGSFPQSFLGLHERIIETVIVSHQKVFPVSKNGRLLNKFVFVSSIASDAPIRGYERVITARLADAASMVLIDSKNPLCELGPKLKQLIFHKRLGSFSEKVQRVRALAKFIAFWVPNASIIKVEEAAELAKLDLLTTFVRDFPKLAGFMGSHYLSLCGETDVEIIDAVRDQYLPVDAADFCPTAPVTVTLALADKIDTLVGLISVKEKVTSTRDPLGIRRSAIGVLRIIIENKLDVPLQVFLMKAIDLYPSSLFFSLIKKIGAGSDEEKQKKDDVVNFTLNFFSERLKALLFKRGVSQAVFASVSDGITRPLVLTEKCIAISRWLKQAEGIEFVQLYKRMMGILRGFSDSAKAKFSKKVLVLPEEMSLIQEFEVFRPLFSNAVKERNFEMVFLQCTGLLKPITVFMDSVLVNVEDHELKKNRIGLLLSITETLDELCDFKVLSRNFS